MCMSGGWAWGGRRVNGGGSKGGGGTPQRRFDRMGSHSRELPNPRTRSIPPPVRPTSRDALPLPCLLYPSFHQQTPMHTRTLLLGLVAGAPSDGRPVGLLGLVPADRQVSGRGRRHPCLLFVGWSNLWRCRMGRGSDQWIESRDGARMLASCHSSRQADELCPPVRSIDRSKLISPTTARMDPSNQWPSVFCGRLESWRRRIHTPPSTPGNRPAAPFRCVPAAEPAEAKRGGGAASSRADTHST